MRTIADLTREVEAFAGLRPDQLDLVAGCGRTQVIERGSYAFRTGEPATTFYAIRSGRIALEIPTPARGPLSLVSIAIDPDQSGEPDFELRVEAWTPSSPFRDSLVTRVYDLATGEVVGSHPINIAPPDAAATVYVSSSPVTVKGRFCSVPSQRSAMPREWPKSS